MTLEERRILVTGGSGFIGSWIAETLCPTNKVSVFDCFSTGKRKNLAYLKKDVKITEGDVREAGKVSHSVKGKDIVFHQAANVRIPLSVKDPPMDADININGTLNVLEACRKHDVGRLVFASSSAIYGDPVRLPVSEDHPKNPKSPYAVSKLAGEEYVLNYHRLYGLETVALRYFNVYGPRQDPSSPYSGVISIFSKRVSEGKGITVYGDGKQTRDFVNVRDVVSANILAAEAKKAPGHAINVGTGESVSLNRLVGIIEKISGKKSSIVHESEREGDVRDSCADITLLRKVLGFKPSIGLEYGLRELLAKL